MSMSLAHDDLLVIAKAIASLEAVPDVTIHQITIGKHKVFLKRDTAYVGGVVQDMQSYLVVGITNDDSHKTQDATPPVYRNREAGVAIR